MLCPHDVPPVSTPDDAAYTTAAVGWLLLLMAVIAFDLWLALSGRKTLSQWMTRQGHQHWWFPWVMIMSTAGLLAHFFVAC